MKAILLMLLTVGIASADLAANARCADGRVVVQNNSSDVWENVKVEVNGDYSHAADAIAPGSTLRYFAHVFTKDDGTRLDLSRIACKRIDIHATVNGKRDHWNGAAK